MDVRHFKLEIFLPETHLRVMQRALREAGAGELDGYDSCLAYSRVTGTWRALPGSAPYLGRAGEASEEPELKIETVVAAERLERAMAAIHAAHPYERPLINVIPLYGTGGREEGKGHAE